MDCKRQVVAVNKESLSLLFKNAIATFKVSGRCARELVSWECSEKSAFQVWWPQASRFVEVQFYLFELLRGPKQTLKRQITIELIIPKQKPELIVLFDAVNLKIYRCWLNIAHQMYCDVILVTCCRIYYQCAQVIGAQTYTRHIDKVLVKSEVLKRIVWQVQKENLLFSIDHFSETFKKRF
jgi:hypothetical protein